MKTKLLYLVCIIFALLGANRQCVAQNLTVHNTSPCDVQVVVYYDPSGSCASNWAGTWCFVSGQGPTTIITLTSGQTFHHVEIHSVGTLCLVGSHTCSNNAVVGFQAGTWSCPLVFPTSNSFTDSCLYCNGWVANVVMSQVGSNYELLII